MSTLLMRQFMSQNKPGIVGEASGIKQGVEQQLGSTTDNNGGNNSTSMMRNAIANNQGSVKWSGRRSKTRCTGDFREHNRWKWWRGLN